MALSCNERIFTILYWLMSTTPHTVGKNNLNVYYYIETLPIILLYLLWNN